jgi:MoaA/NifB/PqqE/SkfB family radical SAM enzyme
VGKSFHRVSSSSTIRREVNHSWGTAVLYGNFEMKPRMESPAPQFQFLTSASVSPSDTLAVVKGLMTQDNLSSEDRMIAGQIVQSLEKFGTVPFDWTPQEGNFIALQPKHRWLKYLIYRYKFKNYPKHQIVADFPFYVLVEPVSTCNLRCVMCFQIDKTFTKKPFMGIMPLDLFQRVVDEAVEGGTAALTLASRGEPTLHPKLADMISYASGKFFDLKINTNATKLTEDLCHAILSSSVNELVFSIDAHEKDLYEEIRVRGKFNEVLANIKRFHDIRARHYPNSLLSTRVSGVKFRSDQNSEDFKAFWSEIADHVVYVDIQNRWDTYNSEVDPELTHPCNYMWERFYIWFDGICNPCDTDYKSNLSPGNLKDSSIREIWRGEAFRQMRETHSSGNRQDLVPCDRCGN